MALWPGVSIPDVEQCLASLLALTEPHSFRVARILICRSLEMEHRVNLTKSSLRLRTAGAINRIGTKRLGPILSELTGKSHSEIPTSMPILSRGSKQRVSRLLFETGIVKLKVAKARTQFRPFRYRHDIYLLGHILSMRLPACGGT
jgi:hypothetical protein